MQKYRFGGLTANLSDSVKLGSDSGIYFNERSEVIPQHAKSTRRISKVEKTEAKSEDRQRRG